jgi:hypothetical protein
VGHQPPPLVRCRCQPGADQLHHSLDRDAVGEQDCLGAAFPAAIGKRLERAVAGGLGCPARQGRRWSVFSTGWPRRKMSPNRKLVYDLTLKVKNICPCAMTIGEEPWESLPGS